MFPALPPGKKPTSTVFSPGYVGAGVRRVNTPVTGASAWGAAAPVDAIEAQQGDGDVPGGGAKKKGKAKKQVLYNWG